MTEAASSNMERLYNILAALPEDIGRRIMERGADIAEGAKLAHDVAQQAASNQSKHPS